MPRPTREFVKMETRLLNDYRFLGLSEFDQLFFLKMLLFARITDNKIPNDNAKIETVLRTGRPLNEIEMSIQRLKEAFPKLRSNKHFHYFLGYNSRMNKYSPKRENNKEPDIDIDIDIDKDIDKDIERDKNIGTKKKKERFTPPTTKEVTDYCKERNNSINATAFIDHYTAKGWRIGKTKMKDWKAAVRTWEQRKKEEKKPKGRPDE